jgi:hypothetical protein
LQEENFCWVILEVIYSPTYPLTMPEKLLLKTNEPTYFPQMKNKFGRPIDYFYLMEMNDKALELAQSLID